MRHLFTALCLVTASAAALPPVAPPAYAAATEDDVSAREAFEATRELGTAEAWEAYLKRFPDGFYADLGRAYLRKLGQETAAPQAAPQGAEASQETGAPAPVPAEEAAPASREAARPEPQVGLGANADLKGLRLLPEDSLWHLDIAQAPVDRDSARILARIGDKPLHPDFGGFWEGVPLGIPYVVVAGTQKPVPVTFTVAEESDPGPYPIPADAPIEGGPKGDGDRHVLVLDRDAWKLYEMFNAFPQRDGSWKAEGGAVWDLRANQVRPDRWTSADAAGLPILPGLVRYDEVVGAGAVRHALRFTLARTRRAYLPPASHWASEADDADLPPMGLRLRLKADYDIAGFHPQMQAILRALKTYGMILADNGSDNFVSGAHDPRWDADILHQLRRVTTKDLEVVAMTGLVVGPRR